MTNQSTVLRGVLRGKTIELDQEPGLPDGQEVRVVVQPVEASDSLPPGEGLRRAFGAWAEDAEELDKYLEWNRDQRRIGRPEIGP
ncbi:MAG: hypothetical protein WD278_00420 [Pirellulales bacterium]